MRLANFNCWEVSRIFWFLFLFLLKLWFAIKIKSALITHYLNTNLLFCSKLLTNDLTLLLINNLWFCLLSRFLTFYFLYYRILAHNILVLLLSSIMKLKQIIFTTMTIFTGHVFGRYNIFSAPINTELKLLADLNVKVYFPHVARAWLK